MLLDTIAASARKRVDAAKAAISSEAMRQKALALPKGNFEFEAALRKPGLSLICEVKKASPSKGVISENFPYLEIARDYEAAGADAVSVLTEPDYFQGNDRYLSEIRQQVKIPLLRKDFVVDPYQIYEAKVLGAHAVLLICALLTVEDLSRYIEICTELGLSALVEAHTEQEVLAAVASGANIIGVNNRDLKTFKVDLETSLKLRPLVPADRVFVAESGIQTAEDIRRLRDAKVDAVLIGETLMRSENKKAAMDALKGGSAS